jgi:hypothetical protein
MSDEVVSNALLSGAQAVAINIFPPPQCFPSELQAHVWADGTPRPLPAPRLPPPPTFNTAPLDNSLADPHHFFDRTAANQDGAMPRAFPIPREHIPRLDVSDTERRACRRLMKRMLAHTLREFETFTYRDKLMADRARWKPQTSHDELAVFREREAGATSKLLVQALGDSLEQQPTLMSKTRAALAPPTLLLSGVGHGRVENAMEAVVTQSQQELALVVTFMHDQVADCAIVHTMEPPQADKPFHFLGFKYFVKRSPTDPRVIKHRHSLYLESTGMTTSSTGETLGFHLMHTVHLSRFPNLSGHHSIEALQSIRYIYRQRDDKLVEVFALANMDLSGMIARPLSNFLVVGAITGVVRLLDLAEARRLTNMARQREKERQEGRRTSSSSSRSSVAAPPLASSTLCSVCRDATRAKRKSSSGSERVVGGLIACKVCGRGVCGRCQASKRIFFGDSDGVMGDFRKIVACTACVAVANASRTEFQHAVRARQRSHRSNVSGLSSSERCAASTPSNLTPSMETKGKPRPRSPLPQSKKKDPARPPPATSRRRDRSSATGAIDRQAGTHNAEGTWLSSAKTAANMEVRPASAPSPPVRMALPSCEPTEAQSPPPVGPDSPLTGEQRQRLLWARLQHLHSMVETTYSLTQQNAAAILGQHAQP